MKTVFFTVADNNYKELFENFKNSFRKFNPDAELILFGEADTKATKDNQIFYRATPVFAQKLFNAGYDAVCKLDCDQIITGNLDSIWEGDFDTATVLNDPSYPIRVLDIQGQYFNNGMVVMKNKAFVDKWIKLCYSYHFNSFQYREQDLLNILCSDYYDYKIKCLDGLEIYGEWGKPFWATSKLVGNNIVITTPEGEKTLKVIHFGGGGGAETKGNFRTRFPEEVSNYILTLIK